MRVRLLAFVSMPPAPQSPAPESPRMLGHPSAVWGLGSQAGRGVACWWHLPQLVLYPRNRY